MKMIRQLFDFRAAPALTAIFVLLLIAEGKRPLRARKQPRLKRMIINAIVSVPSFTLLRFLLLPVMVRLAIKNRELQFGVNYQYKANALTKGTVAFFMLDYSNYLWHILNHKLGFLWRFHLVHHCDPDLDVTFKMSKNDEFPVRGNAVLPFTKALAAAKEFFVSKELPKSVEWLEI